MAAFQGGVSVTYTAPSGTTAATFATASTPAATTTTTGWYILYKGTALTTLSTDYSFFGQQVINAYDH